MSDFVRMLSGLDGDDYWFLIATPLPSPKWSDDLTAEDRELMKTRFIQCAGSAATGLTVEIGEPDAQTPHVYTIGRGGDRTADPSKAINYDHGKYTKRVYPDEVFTADGAAELFFTYLTEGTLPNSVELREYPLD